MCYFRCYTPRLAIAKRQVYIAWLYLLEAKLDYKVGVNDGDLSGIDNYVRSAVWQQT